MLLDVETGIVETGIAVTVEVSVLRSCNGMQCTGLGYKRWTGPAKQY